MKAKDDRLLFEAIQEVFRDQSENSVGLRYHNCNEEFTRLLFSLPSDQQAVIIDYVHAYLDVYTAAFEKVLKKRKFRLFKKHGAK